MDAHQRELFIHGLGFVVALSVLRSVNFLCFRYWWPIQLQKHELIRLDYIVKMQHRTSFSVWGADNWFWDKRWILSKRFMHLRKKKLELVANHDVSSRKGTFYVEKMHETSVTQNQYLFLRCRKNSRSGRGNYSWNGLCLQSGPTIRWHACCRCPISKPRPVFDPHRKLHGSFCIFVKNLKTSLFGKLLCFSVFPGVVGPKINGGPFKGSRYHTCYRTRNSCVKLVRAYIRVQRKYLKTICLYYICSFCLYS